MIKRRYWLFALLMAIAIHAMGFTLFFDTQEDDGAVLPGKQGIEIDLGMMGDLGETNQEQEETASKPEISPEPEPEPVNEPEPVPTPELEPEPVKKPDPVEPKQKTETKVKKAPEQKPESEPVLKPEPVKRPQQVPDVASTAPKQANKTQQRKQTTGKASAATSGGQVAARQSYFGLLAATLAKHKRYPSSSRRRGEEGIVKLFFLVDRHGKVLDYRITESSGSERLDEAVLRMLNNASPLPPFPADMTQQQLEVNVPIAFQLNKG